MCDPKLFYENAKGEKGKKVKREKMWETVLCVVAALVVYYSYWINKWRNPNCNGTLPPGSMGLPLIGETIQICTPSYSLDLHPFIKNRFSRYGLIFRTSLAGRPVVVSGDPEFNQYIVQQEGRAVEMWYMDAVSKLFGLDTEWLKALGIVHKYIRSITLNHFGSEILKDKMLPQIEDVVNQTLKSWSAKASVEVKDASAIMVFNVSGNEMFGYDAKKLSEKITERFTKLLAGFLSFPLNIPGTSYNRCLKGMKIIQERIKEIVDERLNLPETHRGDFLDQAIKDRETEKFITEEFIIQLLFSISIASFESISATLALLLKFLDENRSVVEELTAEHEKLLKNRESPGSPLKWDEYKSMTFTLQVINETLRVGSVTPALLRKATKDIEVKGYTIPAGWTIMLVTSALHLNPKIYKDPLTFNPWRWKELDSITISKNFMPFGGGLRHCAGAEYAKVFLATFIHVLVTKYSWAKIGGGKISRGQLLRFEDGVHVKFSEKIN